MGILYGIWPIRSLGWKDKSLIREKKKHEMVNLDLVRSTLKLRSMFFFSNVVSFHKSSD